MGNQGVYKDFVRYIGMRDRTPTLEQCMEHLAALDTSLNKSQPGSGPNISKMYFTHWKPPGVSERMWSVN